MEFPHCSSRIHSVALRYVTTCRFFYVFSSSPAPAYVHTTPTATVAVRGRHIECFPMHRYLGPDDYDRLGDSSLDVRAMAPPPNVVSYDITRTSRQSPEDRETSSIQRQSV
jgi:hypothetical protein